MMYHIQMSIEGALDLTDKQLGQLFGKPGHKVRAELQERYSKGERLIGAKDCDGFDPVTGCPGHDDLPFPLNQ